MGQAILRDWVVPITGVITMLSLALGIWLSLADYRLKLRAEARLSHSSQVQADVQLLKLFTEIMTIAHARGGYVLSEKAVELLLRDRSLDQLTSGGRRIAEVLADGALLTFPVGAAAQDAAIAAIATLGKQHEVLRDVSIQALESLKTIRPDVAATALKRLAG